MEEKRSILGQGDGWEAQEKKKRRVRGGDPGLTQNPSTCNVSGEEGRGSLECRPNEKEGRGG